jgi:hypothetical protein
MQQMKTSIGTETEEVTGERRIRTGTVVWEIQSESNGSRALRVRET